jgi:predicted RNase H-like HicB family nuclease
MGSISQGDLLKAYHVELAQGEGWYIGRVLERPGVTTQGRSLDELVFMVRDAIELMWGERDVQLELIAAPEIKGRDRHRSSVKIKSLARATKPTPRRSAPGRTKVVRK